MNKIAIFCSLIFITQLSIAQSLPEKSDVMSVLKYQTAVKNQGQRSLCTVFSFTALLESLLLKKNPQLNPKDVNFSEEWVQYLVALQSPSGGGNGARLEDIFKQVKKYGISEEKYLPYDGTLWSEKGPNLAMERCGPIKDVLSQKRCYSSHFSPELIQLSYAKLREIGYDDFANAKASAQENFDIIGSLKSSVVSIKEAKRMLNNGTPVALKVRVYYGSWNHARGDKFGIDRDPHLYAKGIVTYPEAGSVDLIESSKEANLAIHSVLLVGYDDTVVVTYKKLMKDGSTKEFSRRGVFYFKNSWDLRKFGNKFKIGKTSLKGYGMMPQDHAALGQFFTLSL
jgi:hypothetical protein